MSGTEVKPTPIRPRRITSIAELNQVFEERDGHYVVVSYDDLSLALAIISDGVELDAFEQTVIDRLRKVLT